MTRVLALVFAATAVLATGSAHAGTFQVVTCGDAGGGENHSWTVSNNTPSKLDAGDGCSSSGVYSGLYLRDVPDVPNAPPMASARWTFDAPPGTSISALSYSRWLYKEDDDDWQPAVMADGHVIDSCSIVYPAIRCTSGALGGQRAVVSFSDATSVQIGISCAAPSDSTCVNGALGQHAVDSVLYAATVTLAESTSPMLAQTAGGIAADSYLHGSEAATFTASDNTGIRAARIYVDGALQTTTTYACDFTYAIPCSDKSDAAVSLDTRSVADGSHDVQVAVVDPAGNETRSSSRTVVVDNSAPVPPQGLSVEGGADWRSGNSFDVSWTNPADVGSPVAVAHYVLCAIDGSGCEPERQVGGTGLTRLTGIAVPSEGEWGLRVWLADAAGNVDPAQSSEVTLRFGTAPGSPVASYSPPAPTPMASDPVALPSLVAPEPSSTTAFARRDPLLRLSRSPLRDRRIAIRGRLASGVSGSLALTVRVRHGRAIRRQVTVRAGHFKLVLRARHGSALARFPGNSAFRPARATLRF